MSKPALSLAGADTVAVVPFKGDARVKRRLRTALSPERRRALAAAMLEDVVRALLDCALLDRVIVVARGLPRLAIDSDRLLMLRDPTTAGPDGIESGLNAAIGEVQRLAVTAGVRRLVCVAADVPFATTGDIVELIEASDAVGGEPHAVACGDRQGVGTNALVLSPPDVIAPAFGANSLRRHLDAARARGVFTRDVKIDGLAADIDVPADLEALSASGVGGATGRVLGRPASDYQASA